MNRILIAAALAFGLAACDHATDNEKNKPKPTAAAASPTAQIRATDAIGMAGSATADKVDAVIKTNADRTQQLDSELDKKTGE